MAASSFLRALRLTLMHEGGWSNHPRDPGGATMYGVIQRVYDAWRRSRGLQTRSVRLIEFQERDAIYRAQYWDEVRGDQLAPGLDYCLFDYAVNSGPKRAIKDLQRALGVKVDGHFGVVTFATARGVNDVAGLVEKICAIRLSFLGRLRTWNVFGKGWARRVNGVRREAIAMAETGPVTA